MCRANERVLCSMLGHGGLHSACRTLDGYGFCFGETGRDWPTLDLTAIPAPNGRFGVGQEALKTRKPQATSFGPTEALDLAVDVRVNPAGCFRAGDDRLVAGVLGHQGRKTLLERTGQSVTELTNIAERVILECGQQEQVHAPVPIAAVADHHTDDLLPRLDFSPTRCAVKAVFCVGQITAPKLRVLPHDTFVAIL